MSTGDSLSEEVSSSAVLDNENAESSGTKESEISVGISEGSHSDQQETDIEEINAEFTHTVKEYLGDTPDSLKSKDHETSICYSPSKSRYLDGCLEDSFSSGRNLPSINPTSTETLASLVNEIQRTGDSDAEVLRNCETRWLQLFQLVEKQFQDQILAQQEQYQCQIQLIQDEIKALVQLQKKQSVNHNADVPLENTSGNSALTAVHNGCHPGPFLLHKQTSVTSNHGEADRHHMFTDNVEDSTGSVLLSSGYGTLSASEQSFTKCGDSSIKENILMGKDAEHSCSHLRNNTCEENAHEPLNEFEKETRNVLFPDTVRTNSNASSDQRKINSEQLTSWAQKLKMKKTKSNMPGKEDSQKKDAVIPDHLHPRPCGQSSQSYLRKQNDSPSSVVSDVSGLTYWRIEENEMFHLLPENLVSGAYFALKDQSINMFLSDDKRLPASLKEIYELKQKNANLNDWESVSSRSNSRQSAPQVLTLDPTLHMKPSEENLAFCTHSSFGSPFHEELRSSTNVHFSVKPGIIGEDIPKSHNTYDVNANNLPVTQLTSFQKHSLQTNALKSKTWNLHTTSQNPSCTNAKYPAFCGSVQSDSLSQTEEEGSCSLPTPLPRGQTIRSHHASGAECSQEQTVSMSSVEDPVVLSLVRQNLREKHSRHIADLRAYYESEISGLKQQLAAVSRTANSNVAEITHQNLLERCNHLERALTEASSRIKDLEDNNNLLKQQLADWPDRYDTASTTATVLQQRLDEIKNSNKEKDNIISRLKSRLKAQEENFHNVYKLSDDKEARMKKEHKMLQDILSEYESLGKEHERVKDTLVATENKLFDANTEISELRRIISKMEAQIKQLQHENKLRFRHAGHSQSLGVGLFHYPDTYPTPSKPPVETDVAKRKCLSPAANYSIFTGQPLGKSTLENDTRSYSPPEKDCPQKESGKTESAVAPMMKALIEFDKTKATEGRALWKLDMRDSSGRQTISFNDRDNNIEKNTATNTQRNLSPDGHRSSSLPPSNRKSTPCSTPTKRETMISPISAKSSPKRCPTENFSPGFSHLCGRSDMRSDERESSSPTQSYSPRKKLQFIPLEEPELKCHTSNLGVHLGSRTEMALKAVKQGMVIGCPTWENRSNGIQTNNSVPVLIPPYDTDLSCKSRMDSLTETERRFDELTQEKQQTEAALSRLPGSRGRLTLKARLDREALENRLEKINQELGSIRMTLKKFHVLRTSANI
ncbi:M-phase phosphoprotein 9 [Polypterus senegalus]|uniref:M-phase phosphoprotein 9 n=1 Tax=Polypterus senegalus TaxID=55291 RepID=UPI001965CA1D|nr:M-phase phosphoprotein 9 [Polypterus senegalus]